MICLVSSRKCTVKQLSHKDMSFRGGESSISDSFFEFLGLIHLIRNEYTR